MCRASSQNRGRFNFSQSVRRAFVFLEEFDLRETESSDTLVVSQSERVFLNVYHGRSSFELGVELGLLGQEQSYSMSALIRTKDQALSKAYRNSVAADPSHLEPGLSRLSELLRKYGEAALRGDADTFALLRTQQQQWAEEYSRQVLKAQLAPRAADAFREGNYRLAADLYERIEGSLTAAERAKLEYARKKG